MMTDSYEVMLAEEEAVAHVQAMVLRLLADKGMTQNDLAKAMGVSPSHVSQLLADEPQNLSIKKVASVFHALGEEICISCSGVDRLNREAAVRNAQKVI